MQQLLQAYYLYMRNPREGLQVLFSSRAYGAACAGYLLAALAAVCVFNAGDSLGFFSFLFKTAVWFGTELVLGLVMASCAALFLDFSGKKASPAELFILIGTAGFIKGLLIAASVVALACPPLAFIVPLCVLVVLGLQLGYLLRNISRMWEVSGWRACGAVFFCALPAVGGAVLAGLFIIWGLVLLF